MAITCLEAAAQACGEPLTLSTAATLAEGMCCLKQEVPDLAVIDIYLEDGSGITLADTLRQRSDAAKIAFLTISNEFAAESYAVGATDYIIKPPTPEHLERLIRQCQRERYLEKTITLRWHRQEIQLKEKQIHYLKAMGNEVCIYTQGGKVNAYVPMKDIETKLSPELFLRIRRGLITHMGYIRAMATDHCVLENGEEYSLSRKDKADIRKKYYTYQFSKIEEG